MVHYLGPKKSYKTIRSSHGSLLRSQKIIQNN
jgi:hypothetical protein